MYTVIKSIAISKTFGDRWMEVNLATMPVVTIFATYRKVYLTLSAPFLTDYIYVDMESFRLKYSLFTGTLADLFTDNGNETLETIETIPNLEVKRAYYADAFYSGYKIELSEQAPMDRTSPIDIKLSRPDTDVVELHEHTIISVNGFFHLTERDNDFLYVKSGANSMIRSGQNQIGIWSWLNVGKLKHVPITDDMLFKQHEESIFSDRVYIKINEPTEGKTALLFAGGYFIKPDKEIFFPIGNDVYCFNIGRTPFLRRYFESSKYIDFSNLGLDKNSNNETLVSLEQLFSDSVIRKYMTLPQSFITLVDKEDLYFENHFVRHSPMPGMYVFYDEPVYPLFLGAGRVGEYWKTYEDSQWSVTVNDGFRQNKVFETAIESDLTHVGDSNQTTNISFNSMAYLLEAGSDF